MAKLSFLLLVNSIIKFAFNITSYVKYSESISNATEIASNTSEETYQIVSVGNEKIT